ncbi:AAA+ ATPase domain-containing protein, partial [Tanacetum coccineum]
RILVLAATNRPFDLDEAIIRRFERRIMVGLPSVENRGKILQTLLSKEHIEEGLNFSELATMTEGYTGSDLKNLCTTAAYRPVRELIQQERLKDLEKKRRAESGEGPQSPEEAIEEKVITIRPLKMEDFREAKNQVAASFASGGSIMGELKQWNEQYGEGGSRKKEQIYVLDIVRDMWSQCAMYNVLGMILCAVVDWDFVNLLFYGLAVKKDSLWAKWVHMVKSRGRSIWAVKTNVNDSWGWKHILEIRDKIKDHVKLYDARFKEDMKVNEIVSDEKWNWQREWMKEFHAITLMI